MVTCPWLLLGLAITTWQLPADARLVNSHLDCTNGIKNTTSPCVGPFLMLTIAILLMSGHGYRNKSLRLGCKCT